MHPLYALLYVSSALTDFTDEQLTALLATSRRNNTRDGISGMLLYKEQSFMQIIEGTEKAVRALHDRIAADPRHRAVIPLLEGPIPQRQFADWSMGFCNLDSSEGREAAGFNPILNTPFTGTEFSEDPTLAQRLLMSFKRKV